MSIIYLILNKLDLKRSLMIFNVSFESSDDSRLVQTFRSLLIFLWRSSRLRHRSTSDLDPVPQPGPQSRVCVWEAGGKVSKC